MSFAKPIAALTAVSRMRPVVDGLNYVTIASGSNSANTRTLFRSPKNSAITDLTIGMPQFYNGEPEADYPIEYTFTAALEYPIGTLVQCFQGAATTLTVSPGRGIVLFDPLPIRIPADTAFAVKLYLSWTGGSVNFPLNSTVHATYGEWTDVGVDLTDKTLTTQTQTHDYASPTLLRGFGIAPIVYGRMQVPGVVLGILGDSISQGMGDTPDPIYGGISWERGLRNVVPTINVARQAEEFSDFLGRRNGRMALLRDSITHLLVAYGRNDSSNGFSAATMWANLQTTVNLFLAQGIKVYANTVTPVTTSSGSTWDTRVGQTSSGNDSVARAYNDLLRTRWSEIGLTGIFDPRKVVDPTDSGLWNVDHGYSGRYAAGVPSIVNNAIDTVELPTFSSGSTYGGANYALSQSELPCVIYPAPDDPLPDVGGGDVVAITNGSGAVTNFRVRAGGRYSLPPLITPVGRWTYEGTHMTARGYNAVISGCRISPLRFALD